jgi:hypothetical protein
VASRAPLIVRVDPDCAYVERFAGSELYGGSGFREKTLRWVIATVGWRSREIGDMPLEDIREVAAATESSREAGGALLVKSAVLRGERCRFAAI